MTVHDLYERTVREIRGETNRDHRKLANNTYGRIEGDAVIIRLHQTDIVHLTPTTARYFTGGWFTVTTKDRINRWTPNYVKVWSDRGIWHIGKRGGQWMKLSRFYDGLTLVDTPNGVDVVSPALDDPDEPIRKALDRYVKLYTDDRIAELVASAVTGGARGDCLPCQMGTDTAFGGDHLLYHLVDSYTMATLAKNAVEAAGYKSDVYLGMFHPDHYTPGRDHFYGDVIRRSIRKYLKARVLNKGLTLPEEDAA